jgi:serine/threonine protein kinase
LKRPDALDKKIACQIVNDIGRGLKYAHSQGVVHGDLKPSNILLTKTLEAKITDWSMGKSYTLGYASPEQIQGTEPDSKTDVYQLGILFYEMLCGDNPYTHGLQAEMENRTLTWLPDKLSLYDPELKSIDEICLRCLAKNPSDRPTIQEIRDAIYSYLIEYYHLDLRSVPIQDINSQIKISLDEALLSAKNNKIADLDKTLKNIMPKIARNKQVQDAVSQMKQIKIDINVINVHDSVVRNITFPEGIENNIEIQDAVVADMQILKGSLEDGKA